MPCRRQAAASQTDPSLISPSPNQDVRPCCRVQSWRACQAMAEADGKAHGRALPVQASTARHDPFPDGPPRKKTNRNGRKRSSFLEREEAPIGQDRVGGAKQAMALAQDEAGQRSRPNAAWPVSWRRKVVS